MKSKGGFRIYYLDDWYVAIEKPVDWLVHHSPIAPRGEPVLLPLLEKQLGKKLFPVHRLDRGTSGIMLFALTSEGAAAVATQFKDRRIEKTYLAVVRGWFKPSEGTIERPLSPCQGENTQEAKTRYKTLATCERPVPIPPHQTSRYSLVLAFPETGRRQQIRRHFAGAAHPILGDTVHGDRMHNRVCADQLQCERMMLMALELVFFHQWLNKTIRLRSELDDSCRTLIAKMFPDSPLESLL